MAGEDERVRRVAACLPDFDAGESSTSEHIEGVMKDKQWVASRTRTTWKDGRQPETNYDHSWGPFVVELPFNSDLQGCFNDPLLATNFLADTEAKNPYDTASTLPRRDVQGLDNGQRFWPGSRTTGK